MTKPILTVIISTFNEEKNIVSAIESVKKHIKTPHLIIVWDTGSTDQTPILASHAGAKVIKHPPIKVVEEIRQKSIDQVGTEWILIIDADERITNNLGKKIDEVIAKNQADVILIPRLNYFLGQPVKYAGWWPDYQTRLFKKGSLTWPNKIHSQPKTKPETHKLKLSLNYYLTHFNYVSISDFIQRLDRYTQVQSQQLAISKTVTAKDIISQPFNEFLVRYFHYKGYKGGVLGLTMSVFMAFYIFTTYTKAYQLQKHSWQNPSPLGNPKVAKKLIHDYLYWKSISQPQSFYRKIINKFKLWLLG